MIQIRRYCKVFLFHRNRKFSVNLAFVHFFKRVLNKFFYLLLRILYKINYLILNRFWHTFAYVNISPFFYYFAAIFCKMLHQDFIVLRTVVLDEILFDVFLINACLKFFFLYKFKRLYLLFFFKLD